ncbi:S-adenosyl-l-methionine hydroxide adenosyltransferase family protein [Flavobacterium sp.]|jgi:S-adenosylmethionine hydrolase|uniref:SAM hydrolase/SAM-dependent halogenase family protein n=1 Tax=Flavobacterium sp. TaxID=239 RepID=UPI0022BCF6A7|nr:SAM-dependent chlorinase/fluorinase [Flavobacterium sp.]MCZ8145014.1 SAM-dependent chlorinase/fluorinase [Flavobacterium sp.]MCZ8368016.1 SAM-dependent chlorinase/fluorinase [Flavobacterium sp.]
MSIITLTTDFGHKDYFVGALKGQLYTHYPEVRIVDLSHEVAAFDLAQASYLVGAGYRHFPKGTVHIIGVDAGRTPSKRHIAALWEGHYFIAADNGVLGMIFRKKVPETLVEITIHDRLHEQATDMEVFATVAVHLGKGGALSVIGKTITTLNEVTELQPVIDQEQRQLKGYVMYIDHFGNAVTNIEQSMFVESARGRSYEILVKREKLKTIFPHYHAIEALDAKIDHAGKTMAIFNEAGYLEIGIYKSTLHTGNAASLLGLRYRDAIWIEFKS